ncbi:mCG144915, partial [Mus musculus]
HISVSPTRKPASEKSPWKMTVLLPSSFNKLKPSPASATTPSSLPSHFPLRMNCHVPANTVPTHPSVHSWLPQASPFPA